jgi:hypothetical protein
VLVFLESTSGSSLVSLLSPVENDGKEILGLKASLPSSGGFSPSLGGALLSFAEVVRSEGPVKVRISPAERRELGFLPAARLAEEMRVAMDCSVLKQEPSGEDWLVSKVVAFLWVKTSCRWVKVSRLQYGVLL